MWLMILAGTVALVAGILFLFSPKTLHQLSTKINTTINKMVMPIDEKIYKLRIGVGISLLLVAVLIFFVVYYLAKKYNA